MPTNAAALAARICDARDAGRSDEEILQDNSAELTALLAAPTFLAIATTVIPLVVSITREVRSGKKLLEVLAGRATEILEAVLTVLPIVLPKQADSPNVAPVIPRSAKRQEALGGPCRTRHRNP